MNSVIKTTVSSQVNHSIAKSKQKPQGSQIKHTTQKSSRAEPEGFQHEDGGGESQAERRGPRVTYVSDPAANSA